MPSRLARHGGPLALLAALLCLLVTAGAAGAADTPFLSAFHSLKDIGSTVPANGDQNPYGIVAVPQNVGSLVKGDLLISNFNNLGSPPSGNLQGTGRTLVQVSPSGALSLFAQIDPASLPGPCPGGVGLTTALAVLDRGYVVVGSLPTSDGSSNTAMPGCLIVLDSTGHVVETISGPLIKGPWDMTVAGGGGDPTLFVTNVLNGDPKTALSPGTVVRIGLHLADHRPPAVTSEDVIANGFAARTDQAALVIGPTGLALGHGDVLYVADTANSRIAAIPDATHRNTALGGGGLTVASGGFLNGPLGLILAPNGDLLSANANDGGIVESTPTGFQFGFDTGNGGGSLFGLALAPARNGVYFVNDGDNMLNELTTP